MKKIFLLILALVFAFAFAFSACKQKEVYCYEEPEVSESSEESEGNWEKEVWQGYLQQLAKDGVPEKDVEKLMEWGLTREEIMNFKPRDINQRLGAIEAGIEKEKMDYVENLLSNPDSAGGSIIYSGTNGTKNLELAEEFIRKVENGKPAFVSGMMEGYTFLYYFELSFEPGEMIKLTQIWPYSGYKTELSEIYDAENFYYFSGCDGIYFSVPKINLYTEERFQTEPGEDIPDMPVTAKEAEEEAKKIHLLASSNSSGEKEKQLLGSYGHVITSGNAEDADEFDKNLVPRVTGHAVLEGEHYYMVSLLEGDTDIGISYAVSAEKPISVFSISAVDGSFRPIAYDIKPRVELSAP